MPELCDSKDWGVSWWTPQGHGLGAFGVSTGHPASATSSVALPPSQGTAASSGDQRDPIQASAGAICQNDAPKAGRRGSPWGSPFLPGGSTTGACLLHRSAQPWGALRAWGPPQLPGPKSSGKLQSGKLRAGAGGEDGSVVAERRRGQGERWRGRVTQDTQRVGARV